MKRKSVTQSFLGGLTFDSWLKLLRENKFAVSPVYWPRAQFITALSLYNSSYLRKERRLFQADILKTEITNPPLFILGHWRHGTTHLHNLLANDDSQFAYCNTYQATNPRIFLSAEEINIKRFSRLTPKKRAMDNMAFAFQNPEEDEFATALTSFRSPYLKFAFPRRQEHYDRYATFNNASETEFEQWKTSFIWFLKKLTFKYQHRSLLLKSPPHTGRLNHLLNLFPDARFVHIHRNPYEVFQSTRHLNNVMHPHWYLQNPDKDMTEANYILHQYNSLYDAFFRDRELIPTHQFHELSFEALEEDPIKQIGIIYEKLQLNNFREMEPKLYRYNKSLKSYKKNNYPELSSSLRHQIRQTWQRSFDNWRYASYY